MILLPVFALRRCRFVLALALVVAHAGRSTEPEPLAARVAALRREIARHDDLYFRAAAPEISDAAYDRLKQELESLEAELRAHQPAPPPVERPIGDDRQDGFVRAAHHEPMLSLRKADTDDALGEFFAELAATLGRERLTFLVEPKLDGVAISVTYAEGRLVHALSRGNGREGDDVTASLRAANLLSEALAAAPQEPWPALIELRGEVFVARATLKALNAQRAAAGEPPFAHPRNLAAGAVRLRDADEIARRGLELRFHGAGAIQPAARAPTSQAALYRALEAWGLPVVDHQRVSGTATDLRDAVRARQQLNGRARYPTDGVVAKLDAFTEQRRLGNAPTAPRWAIARKFPNGGVPSRVETIRWQPGRTGRLTPVAEIAPVQVEGSLVRRVNLHGAAELQRLDVREGDTVWVQRAGGVVPALVAVEATGRRPGSTPVTLPTVCPACHAPLVSDLRCAAERCPARVQRRIEHFAGPAGLAIEGLGPATIARLVATGRVQGPADLYSVDGDKGSADSSDELRAAIARSRTAPLSRWIAALGLPGVGPIRARQVAAEFGDLKEFAEAGPEQWRAAGLPADAVAMLASAEVRELFGRVLAAGPIAP